MTSILSLSDELLIEIFQYLPFGVLNTSGYVCVKFKQIAGDILLLQKGIKSSNSIVIAGKIGLLYPVGSFLLDSLMEMKNLNQLNIREVKLACTGNKVEKICKLLTQFKIERVVLHVLTFPRKQTQALTLLAHVSGLKNISLYVKANEKVLAECDAVNDAFNTLDKDLLRTNVKRDLRFL